MLVSLVGGLNVDILSFLFAPILTVAWSDIWLMVALLSVTIVVLAIFYKEFFLVTFDPEGARVSGLPVRALDIGFTVMTAVTVVLAMRVVGILLVSGREVDPQRPDVRVAERIVPERSALEPGLLEPAGEVRRPGQHQAGEAIRFAEPG